MLPFDTMGFEEEGSKGIPILPPIERKGYIRPISPISRKQAQYFSKIELEPTKKQTLKADTEDLEGSFTITHRVEPLGRKLKNIAPRPCPSVHKSSDDIQVLRRPLSAIQEEESTRERACSLGTIITSEKRTPDSSPSRKPKSAWSSSPRHSPLPRQKLDKSKMDCPPLNRLKPITKKSLKNLSHSDNHTMNFDVQDFGLEDLEGSEQLSNSAPCGSYMSMAAKVKRSESPRRRSSSMSGIKCKTTSPNKNREKGLEDRESKVLRRLHASLGANESSEKRRAEKIRASFTR
ncbi:hypothetical protein CAPTEDRAFT_220863 [Capitella teleta]|uniref:Uncharacterized protein n=1 Tax=Capitella teleta TaxID=283909 RepID=R7UUC4_CAPTE|nr:hypothetical protein CAPTEDRAFT_220863 [Capitella teleta]|eukprot:ELU09795.1 hypothetical protein CAPTEDRAFT_220863 [Capitella teleta]